jgi:hypothetical protein
MTSCDKPADSGKRVNILRICADASVALRPLTVWIWFCAGLNVTGWALSAIGQLNAIGYIVVLLLGAATFFVWWVFDKTEQTPRSGLRKWLHRFKRPFPLAFLVLSAMAFLGGVIYPPTNYDGLAYRLPRVLHWLAAGQWHWIHTDFPRLNNRACGIEWVSAPLVAILKTDRLLFLINFISFLFLPGLTFGVLTRLGVRRRVAWHWMWIAPTGYCFLLQAASIGNDAFGAPFALAAILFALRARESGRALDLFNSILSAALLTASKTSNLPLLLPWAIAILPALRIVLQRPIATAAVCLLCIFSSFLPTAVLNSRYCGDWSGLRMEALQAGGGAPLRLGANIAYISMLNLVPPVFPEADQWNRFENRVVPTQLNARLHQVFTEPQAAEFRAEQMQIEENGGFGFGPTVFLAASALVAAVRSRRSFFRFQLNSFDGLLQTGIVLTLWIAALALLTQSRVAPIGRIMAPYYILLLPLLLRAPCQEHLVRKVWWRASAFFVFALAAGLLIISPARPLFPVGHLLAKLQAEHTNLKSLARIEEVYSVYHDRNHAFAPALAVLPPNEKVLGMVTYDDPEAALWQPFGSRQVLCVKPDDTAAWLKARGVQYILARGTLFGDRFPQFNDWAKRMNAVVVRKIPLNIRAGTGPLEWYLLELN